MYDFACLYTSHIARSHCHFQSFETFDHAFAFLKLRLKQIFETKRRQNVVLLPNEEILEKLEIPEALRDYPIKLTLIFDGLCITLYLAKDTIRSFSEVFSPAEIKEMPRIWSLSIGKIDEIMYPEDSEEKIKTFLSRPAEDFEDFWL